MSMTIESGKAMTKKPRRYLNTKTADERGFATQQPSTMRVAPGAWDAVFQKLIEWGKSPGRIDEDGLEFPSFEAISQAIEVIRISDNGDEPAPNSVVPDGEGGIALNWSSGDELASIQVAHDGTVEYLKFIGARLVGRFQGQPLPG
jgi:hypothetical protein